MGKVVVSAYSVSSIVNLSHRAYRLINVPWHGMDPELVTRGMGRIAAAFDCVDILLSACGEPYPKYPVATVTRIHGR